MFSQYFRHLAFAVQLLALTSRQDVKPLLEHGSASRTKSNLKRKLLFQLETYRRICFSQIEATDVSSLN